MTEAAKLIATRAGGPSGPAHSPLETDLVDGNSLQLVQDTSNASASRHATAHRRR
jgi:hypothetical protein